MLTWYFHSFPGKDPSKVKVLKVAPTGVAAFNIYGYTIHSAFSVPIGRFGDNIGRLYSETFGELGARFCELEMVIIDEISMVGKRLLKGLDARLREILGSEDTFGGKHVIFVGDFFQLRPVRDSFVFEIGNDPVSIAWNDVQMFELTEIMRQK